MFGMALPNRTMAQTTRHHNIYFMDSTLGVRVSMVWLCLLDCHMVECFHTCPTLMLFFFSCDCSHLVKQFCCIIHLAMTLRFVLWNSKLSFVQTRLTLPAIHCICRVSSTYFLQKGTFILRAGWVSHRTC